jgi:CheY-like chemotaxis protein
MMEIIRSSGHRFTSSLATPRHGIRGEPSKSPDDTMRPGRRKANPQRQTSEMRAAASSLHLLLIDDHPLVAGAIRTILEREGHRVVVALRGQEGLDAFRRAQEQGEPFAAVITDYSLPDLDGLAVAAEVKRISVTTAVIMLTAYAAEATTDGLPANVDSLLGKPPALDALRAALRRAAASGSP